MKSVGDKNLELSHSGGAKDSISRSKFSC